MLLLTTVLQERIREKLELQQKCAPRATGGKIRTVTSVKHARTLRMSICMKWRDTVHGCMMYTELAERAAVSRGTSRVTTKQNYVDIQNVLDIQNVP